MLLLAWNNSGLNVEGRKSLIRVFCKVNNASYTRICSFKPKLIVRSRSWSLVLKISFEESFLHYIQSFFFYIFVNLVMFFSLFFVCTCLWMLDYLRFTKYGLVFMWLTVTENKFMKGVFCCRQNFSNTKKVITCKYHQKNTLWNTLCIFQMWGKYGEKTKDFSKDTN